MRILILGGTADARKIAQALLDNNIDIIYSVAGLVRQPDLSCQVISGGFTMRGGLVNYLNQQNISLVIDATHPYALQITTKAVQACQELNVHYLRFDRPAWQAVEGDHWLSVFSWEQVVAACNQFKKPFLTTGQLSEQQIASIANDAEQVIYRTAASATATLAENVHWIKAIGPFKHATEQALMVDWGVDVLVSKNAGGSATYAKLTAARALGLPVIMLQRPQCSIIDRQSSQVMFEIDAVIEYVTNQLC